MCSKEKLLKETTELINSIAEKFVAPKIYKQVLNQLNRFIIYKLRPIFTLMPANKDEDRFDNAYATALSISSFTFTAFDELSIADIKAIMIAIPFCMLENGEAILRSTIKFERYFAPKHVIGVAGQIIEKVNRAFDFNEKPKNKLAQIVYDAILLSGYKTNFEDLLQYSVNIVMDNAFKNDMNLNSAKIINAVRNKFAEITHDDVEKLISFRYTPKCIHIPDYKEMKNPSEEEINQSIERFNIKLREEQMKFSNCKM